MNKIKAKIENDPLYNSKLFEPIYRGNNEKVSEDFKFENASLKQILKDKKFELENEEVEPKDIKMSFNILLDNYEKAQIDNDEYTKKIDIMISKSLQTENKIKNVYLTMNHKAEKVENLEYP